MSILTEVLDGKSAQIFAELREFNFYLRFRVNGDSILNLITDTDSGLERFVVRQFIAVF